MAQTPVTVTVTGGGYTQPPVDTPPTRTYTVPAEHRTLVVSAEPRTLTPA